MMSPLIHAIPYLERWLGSALGYEEPVRGQGWGSQGVPHLQSLVGAVGPTLQHSGVTSKKKLPGLKTPPKKSVKFLSAPP